MAKKTLLDNIIESIKGIDGRLIKQSGTTEQMISDLNYKVVTPAKSAADSAVAYANDAIKKSRVNSQAIDDINSAVSDAKQGANDAMIRAKSAWDAAQSNVSLIDLNYASASASISSARTEAIAAADEAKASASAAQADIVAVRSDVAVAKSEIAITKTNLASQAKGLSSYAAQASAAGKDITTLKSQAGQFEQDMADTKGDVIQLKVSASAASASLSDAAGNISSLQATAKSYSAALSDTNGNVASVTATARELENKYADAAGDISKIKTDAKGMTQTISNAQGDIAKLKTRADGIEAKYADAAGDINTLKADASGFSQTLVSAKGDISTLQSTATGLKNTLTDAKGNISTLQSDVSGLKKTTSDHAGNIATLQADTKTLTSQMTDAQGDISTLKQTASGFSSKVSGVETSLADANSKINGITSNGGGRNLLWGTGTASGDVAGGSGIFVKGAFNGYDAVKTNYAWSERLINLKSALGRTNAKAGDWYTISVYVKADNQINDGFLGVYRALGNVDANTNDGFLDGIPMQNKPITTQWQQYSWSFQINDISLQRQSTRVEYSQDTGDNWIYWAGWMLEEGTVAHTWSPAPEDTDAKITANTTAIEQNKNAITLKADQTTVDKTNGTVQQLQSQLKVQADQIASKVSSSDLDAKGYATQTYTQTQIKQTSDSWNANLTSVKNGLTQSYTNLHATVDGIQAQVYNSDGSSKITQLSNLIQSKVSQGDYNSQITQLKNDINLRVQKGDVISQINQEAGGNTLIQVSNGNGSLILDAANTIVKGKEWIPVAAIADLTADQVQAGTLKGVKVDFRDSTGTGMTADGSKLTFYVNNASAGYLSYNGMPVAELPDGSGGNEIEIRYGLSTAIIPDDNSGAQATFSKAAQKIAYMTGTDRGKQILSGLEVHSNNHHWLCAVNSDATCNRFEVNDRDGLNIAWHDNTHFWISDGNAKLYKDNDDSPTATKLEVHGWAWINGWVEAAGHSQHSALSTKTDIQAIDDDEMLAMVNNTDLASFLFKTDVASGETHRHIGLIIDDVHDVAQYQAPQDFIAPNGVSRDDDNMIGALFGAVKALTKRIKTLESKVG